MIHSAVALYISLLSIVPASRSGQMRAGGKGRGPGQRPLSPSGKRTSARASGAPVNRRNVPQGVARGQSHRRVAMALRPSQSRSGRADRAGAFGRVGVPRYRVSGGNRRAAGAGRILDRSAERFGRNRGPNPRQGSGAFLGHCRQRNGHTGDGEAHFNFLSNRDMDRGFHGLIDALQPEHADPSDR